MIDRREEILARLRVIIGGIPGIQEAGRNRENISAARRPAIIMHDAAESSSALSERPSKSFNDMMVLTPQIYVLLGGRTEEVGAMVGPFRAAVIKAIYTDDTLKDLVGGRAGNGDIHYTGCGLDTTSGESREARLEISFEITYPLLFAELTAP